MRRYLVVALVSTALVGSAALPASARSQAQPAPGERELGSQICGFPVMESIQGWTPMSVSEGYTGRMQRVFVGTQTYRNPANARTLSFAVGFHERTTFDVRGLLTTRTTGRHVLVGVTRPGFDYAQPFASLGLVFVRGSSEYTSHVSAGLRRDLETHGSVTDVCAALA